MWGMEKVNCLTWDLFSCPDIIPELLSLFNLFFIVFLTLFPPSGSLLPFSTALVWPWSHPMLPLKSPPIIADICLKSPALWCYCPTRAPPPMITLPQSLSTYHFPWLKFRVLNCLSSYQYLSYPLTQSSCLTKVSLSLEEIALPTRYSLLRNAPGETPPFFSFLISRDIATVPQLLVLWYLDASFSAIFLSFLVSFLIPTHEPSDTWTSWFLDFRSPWLPTDFPKRMMDSFKVGLVAFISSSLSLDPESVNRKCWLNERYKKHGCHQMIFHWGVTWLSPRPYLAHLFPPCPELHVISFKNEPSGRVVKGLHFSCSKTSLSTFGLYHHGLPWQEHIEWLIGSSWNWADLIYLDLRLVRKNHDIQVEKFKLDY